ncbi:MAG: DnaJ domain-containing protein [Bradyrhizobium sp.]|nr:DnaJ domain-containing protein [Bradyrhizobium sp.]
MPTLYELLGALADDDADGLRRAFRKAAKASHPDNNPGDPDAAQRFRRIVRAHAILSDEAQRAAYDECLIKAQQQARDTERSVLSELRRLAPGAVLASVIALISIATFLLVEKVSTMRLAPARVQAISTQASALAAAMPAQPSDTVGRAAEHERLDRVPVINAPAAAAAVKEMPAPVATASADKATVDKADVIPPGSDVVVKDAEYYRDRGGLAYRNGDLPMALIDFDLAINLDPNSAEAYINRAIVFRRMGDMKDALADVAEAKRIDDLRPQQTAPLSGNH